DWLNVPAAEAVDDGAAYAAEVPDWLSELEVADVPDSIPEWLTESVDEPAATPEPEPEPQPVYQPPAPAAARQNIPAPEALAEARERARSGELAAALDTYEALVRGSRELDSVVADLQSLVRQHRTNPVVF